MSELEKLRVVIRYEFLKHIRRKRLYLILGLALLADRRDAFGTWGSPQTTYWALQAFATALQTDPVPILPAQEAAVSISVGV